MARTEIYYDLLVALGNPGTEYEGTRHNAGFIVADAFAETCDGISSEFKLAGATARKFTIAENEVHILKPQRYMNLSGEAVAAFIAKKKIPLERVMVVHDDMDIQLGKFKLCFGAGAAGHNGVQSIINCIGSANFARLRFGIGRRNGEMADYVLSRFTTEEEKKLKEAVELSVSALKFSLVNGISAAMNKFNRRLTINSEEIPVDNNKQKESKKI